MNLEKYVTELNNIYEESRNEWQLLQDRLVKIGEEELDVNKSSNSRLRRAADVEEMENEKKDINQKLTDLQNSADKKFDDVTERFDAEITDFFTAKPEDVDQAAILLINSGALTDPDLYALTEKYSENATMLKMIAKEAEKRESTMAASLAANINAFMVPNGLHEILHGAVLTLYRALSPNKGLADPNDNYWRNESFEKTRREIAEAEVLDISGLFRK